MKNTKFISAHAYTAQTEELRMWISFSAWNGNSYETESREKHITDIAWCSFVVAIVIVDRRRFAGRWASWMCRVKKEIFPDIFKCKITLLITRLTTKDERVKKKYLHTRGIFMIVDSLDCFLILSNRDDKLVFLFVVCVQHCSHSIQKFPLLKMYI